jgi:hypothetical protein
MRPDELRDTEIETLIRAAFRNADQVVLRAGSNRDNSRQVVVTDRATLDELAGSFALGRNDNETLPHYRSPGLTYARVTFEGSYPADFQFTDDTVIWLYGQRGNPGARHELEVRTVFSKSIRDALRLGDEQPPTPP